MDDGETEHFTRIDLFFLLLVEFVYRSLVIVNVLPNKEEGDKIFAFSGLKLQILDTFLREEMGFVEDEGAAVDGV